MATTIYISQKFNKEGQYCDYPISVEFSTKKCLVFGLKTD